MWFWVAAVWVATGWAATLDSVPNPRLRGGWVSDGADVIAADAEARMEARLDALYRETDAEITVVTVDTASGDPKTFATELFNRWGVGDARANNGVLVLLVTGERALEMETGYGVEGVLPDGWLGSMQAREMVPYFKQGDYSGGMEAGIEALDARLRLSPEEVREGTRGAVGGATARQDEGVSPAAAGLGVLGTAGTGGLIVFLAARNRKKKWTCRACGTRLEQLDEEADDAHLEPGQVAEERVGSVDWIVRVCPKCQEIHVFEDAKWFSSYSRCAKCLRRTSRSERRTLQHATYTSGGLVEVTSTCAHCKHHTRQTYNTARKVRSTTTHSGGFGGGRSSGGGFSGGGRSSGGSFGGGRSGGGGAGSRW